jgi:hypothetical protein
MDGRMAGWMEGKSCWTRSVQLCYQKIPCIHHCLACKVSLSTILISSHVRRSPNPIAPSLPCKAIGFMFRVVEVSWNGNSADRTNKGFIRSSTRPSRHQKSPEIVTKAKALTGFRSSRLVPRQGQTGLALRTPNKTRSTLKILAEAV